MFLNIRSSIDSFQIISLVFIIYQKHCDVRTLKAYNINNIFDTKNQTLVTLVMASINVDAPNTSFFWTKITLKDISILSCNTYVNRFYV